MKQDIANLFNDAYSQSAPVVLGDQHRFLLGNIESHLANNPGNLLVLGCGAQVLPYSVEYDGRELGKSNVARIKKMMEKGSIVFADYSLEGLKNARNNLAEAGFYDNAFGDEGIVEHIDDLHEGSIAFLHQDLNDPLRVRPGSFSAIDANLSTHHVTARVEDMKRLYSDIKKALSLGGVFHLGEGNVDMGYSEQKINQVRKDLTIMMAQDVKIVDRRDRERVFGKGELEATIDQYGCLHFLTPNARGMKQQMQISRYRQVIASNDMITIPLIDPEILQDKEHIKKVDRYYAEISGRAVKGYHDRPKLLFELEKAIKDERGKARRGLVEYYRDPKLVKEMLEQAGLKVVKENMPDGPFYNYLAIS